MGSVDTMRLIVLLSILLVATHGWGNGNSNSFFTSIRGVAQKEQPKPNEMEPQNPIQMDEQEQQKKPRDEDGYNDFRNSREDKKQMEKKDKEDKEQMQKSEKKKEYKNAMKELSDEYKEDMDY